MALKPWYKVVTPREDLREGRPLDASEFAVHLDQVRDGRANKDYQDPERFFERTYLTENLKNLSAEVIRRLSGEKTETSAVFNMATQFGGGKTHALTLLYHLAQNGKKASNWRGVRFIVQQSGVKEIPKANTATFVGTEFDSITGRGGDDGTPLRKTPWGEIAFQLGGNASFDVVKKHDEEMTAPSGEVIRKFLPNDKPNIILVDELMNYISRSRKMGIAAQMYNFLQNLSEEARAQDNVVLVVSVPASEMEMNAEEQSEYDRLKKLLDRLGKAVIMSAEQETSEIIRRRLFEWGGLPDDAKKTVNEYNEWLSEYRQSLPNWFPFDSSIEYLQATYPFHPTAISVFERKWAALPRFQRTRGILRLLALWVSRAWEEGYKGNHKDTLIGLGTAPLDDPLFRAAAFEQLGETRLEGAVTTDICGKKDSNAVRLDKEAIDSIKKSRLHRKVATTIFFESNGGQSQGYTTLPEIRLAVSEPDLDIANVETVIDGLVPPDGACYYMDAAKNRYWFSIKPNLNKLLSDRRASVQSKQIEDLVKEEIQSIFNSNKDIKRVFFPEKSNQISDSPALTVVVLAPEYSMQDSVATMKLVESMTKEHGTSSRTFKNALIWCVPESPDALYDAARKMLAWEAIEEEKEDLKLDDGQRRQLNENLKKAKRDIKEAVWRTYKNLMLLSKDNSIRHLDLGLVHSSAADSVLEFIIDSLRKEDEVTEYIQPRKLVTNWPPAFKEWSTKQVRDAVYASPQFSRLLNPEKIKDTIARGVSGSMLAYVAKAPDGRYDPFVFGDAISENEIEISDEVFIISAEEAKKHIEPPKLSTILISPQNATVQPGHKQTFTYKALDQHGLDIAIDQVKWSTSGGDIDDIGVFACDEEGSFVIKAKSEGVEGSCTVIVAKPGAEHPPSPEPPPEKLTSISWRGEVPSQKWMNFYTKVLSKHAGKNKLSIEIAIRVLSESGFSEQEVNEIKTALRELGLDEELNTF